MIPYNPAIKEETTPFKNGERIPKDISPKIKKWSMST